MLDLSSRKVYGALAEQCVGGDAKADKVETAVAGHLAGLDANGNLTDSGVSPTEDVTVEGNPVQFDSPFEQDAKSVVVSVKPIQDLHGYDHPWVGGAGKNKFGLPYKSTTGGAGINVVVNDDSTVRFYGEATGDFYFTFKDSDIPLMLPAGTYTLSAINEIPQNVAVYCTGGSLTGSGNIQITLDSETNLGMYIHIPPIAGAVDFTLKLQLESGSSPTPYAPYSNECPISGIDKVEIGVSDGESAPITTTIPLPSTLYDADVDVTEGSATENNKMILLSDIEWAGANGTFYNETPVDIKHGDGRYDHCISDCYKTENKATTGQLSDGALSVDSSGFIQIKDSRYATTSALISAMGNTQLLYELAIPTTISFTPADVELLEGTNVVSTNAEKVAVTYGRSLWQDIDELKTDTEGKLNKSDVADVEGDTASRPYSVNEFMLRSDGFYKVTQPIAQNASITSSNTTKTTIGAVLTALLNS